MEAADYTLGLKPLIYNNYRLVAFWKCQVLKSEFSSYSVTSVTPLLFNKARKSIHSWLRNAMGVY